MLQNWDQLVMLLAGAAVVVHSAVNAWRLWKRAQRKAAVGVLCVGLAALILPIVLSMAAH